ASLPYLRRGGHSNDIICCVKHFFAFYFILLKYEAVNYFVFYDLIDFALSPCELCPVDGDAL
ncbi:hypothetical protein, partial [Vibrio azureus]|uniref:hypothetical protein n=1 Tax=Vibrio azureus TaxID=512649 RepID=UPI0005188A8A